MKPLKEVGKEILETALIGMVAYILFGVALAVGFTVITALQEAATELWITIGQSIQDMP